MVSRRLGLALGLQVGVTDVHHRRGFIFINEKPLTWVHEDIALVESGLLYPTASEILSGWGLIAQMVARCRLNLNFTRDTIYL
jgi:hypothetical protein